MSTENENWIYYDAECAPKGQLGYNEEKPNLYGNNAETDKLVASSNQSDDNAEIDMILQRPSASCHQQFTDFSNVFKAFIGSALIGLPFAIRNAGIALGLIGILLIAIATDHCCTLIVKCKEIVIKKMCHRMVAEGYVDAHIEEQRKILGRTLSFGQMGKVTMGKLGTFLVDTSIVITQIGFCVGYFIFLGNTARSVVYEFLQYQHIGITNMNNSFPINFTNVTTMIPMESLATTEHTTVLPLTTMRFASTGRSEATTMLEKAATLNSTGNQSYFVSANTSLQSFIMTTTLPLNMTYGSKKNNTGFISNILSKIKNHLSTIKEKIVNAKLDNPITHRTLQENKAWTFSLLLVIPAPLLILISFIRNLRKLGPVSVLANGSITGAFLATAIYILVDFKSPHETITWFNFFKFPIFFGQVTGAFEGIGTVIPIEGSMAENRGRYPCYLHISLFLLSSILGSFGTLGYLRYGNETNQIVTENLEGSAIVIALRCLLFFGVLFTYPLQIYPVIQIFEGLIFGPNSTCNKGRYRRQPSVNGSVEGSFCDSVDEEEGSIMNPVIKIPTWQSNVLRAGLVLLTAVIAVVFRSQFAYIAALTGSIGSSLLSYILPCIFHIKLQRRTMSKWIFAKDLGLIMLGVVGGIMGMTVTILEIVRTFGSHHQLHHHH